MPVIGSTLPNSRAENSTLTFDIFDNVAGDASINATFDIHSATAKSDGKGKKKPQLTEHERGKIEGLREAGLSLRAIKTITSRSLDTIRRVVSPASPPQPNRRGPAPLLSKRHVRLVMRTAVQGNLSSAQLKAELSLPVSVRTVQRILAEVDWLVYSKMENTLPLTAADMVARKTWTKNMLLRADAGSVWDSIIFSDEQKWNLDGPDGFQYYWRDLR